MIEAGICFAAAVGLIGASSRLDKRVQEACAGVAFVLVGFGIFFLVRAGG